MYAVRHSNRANQAAYRAAKSSLRTLEDDGAISLQILQANIFIALFEISHALYPAAYLTVGHCARLGQAIGLHNRRYAPQLLPSERESKALPSSYVIYRIWL